MKNITVDGRPVEAFLSKEKDKEAAEELDSLRKSKTHGINRIIKARRNWAFDKNQKNGPVRLIRGLRAAKETGLMLARHKLLDEVLQTFEEPASSSVVYSRYYDLAQKPTQYITTMRTWLNEMVSLGIVEAYFKDPDGSFRLVGKKLSRTETRQEKYWLLKRGHDIISYDDLLRKYNKFDVIADDDEDRAEEPKREEAVKPEEEYIDVVLSREDIEDAKKAFRENEMRAKEAMAREMLAKAQVNDSTQLLLAALKDAKVKRFTLDIEF